MNRISCAVALSISVASAVIGCSSTQQSQQSAELKRGGGDGGSVVEVSSVEQRLDSLASISDGDYIHLVVGQCFGRCDGYVSLWRISRAGHYVYEAEGWKFDEQTRDFILYRLRRPIGTDEANTMLRAALKAGMYRLQNDSTMFVTDQPSIWLRASINGEKIVIDNAYTGGEKYASGNEDQQLGSVYQNLRSALLARLFNR
jgi:hypothetical protein